MSNAPADLPSRLIAAANYVLEGEYVCHECGCIVPVFGLMPVAPFDRWATCSLPRTTTLSC